MKKLKILALLLAAVLMLTCFGGTFAFAEEGEATDTTTTGTDTSTDEDAATEDGEGEDGEEGSAGALGSDRTVYLLEDLTAVDPTDPENASLLTAANKAADGREVTVYSLALAEKMTVEASNDFVGVALYNETDASMSLMTPTIPGTPYTYYDLDAAQAGVTAYLLVVASIPDSEIAWVTDPTTPEPQKMVWKQENRGLFTSAAQRVRAMTVYYESDDVILYADDQLAEIAVYNKKHDQYFFSTPYDYRRVGGVSSNDIRNRIASLVEIAYYDNSANRKEVFSFSDAVEKNYYAETDDPDDVDNIQYTAEAIDNGVRFNFEIGTKKIDSLLPYASVASTFEEKVIKPLEEMKAAGSDEAAKALRKFNAYYTLYHYEDLSASMRRSIETNYPGIVEHDLYVKRGTYPRETQMLSDWIKMAGVYTWEDYRNDLEISGYVPDDVALALFEFHVDFTIENGELVVDMPTGKDDIKYDTTNFTMAEVTLMRYFGSGTYTDDGYLFMPDGSGTVINFNTDGTKDSLSMRKSVYGDDYALSTMTAYQNLSQSGYLPVFGLKANQRGYLGILEKGDAMATIKSETGNLQSAYEAAYPTFVYNTVQSITYADGSKMDGDFTYFNSNTYNDGFRIRYKLFYGDDITYVTMAKAYREYLLANKLLIEKVDTSNKNVPLVLETLGLIDKKASFYGIVYDKKIPMSSFDDAEAMIEELIGGGVSNVSLRYRGWMNGGLNYSVPSKLKIEKKLGGNNGFADLVSYMKDKNFTLFPEVDFCVVRRDGLFDGYTTNNDAPKATDRTTITLTPRNELDNILEITKNYFAISPSSSTKYFDSFFGKYTKFDTTSVSLGTVGSMLYSDFRTGEQASHRQKTVATLAGNVEKYVTGNNLSRVMVEGGNAYTYTYATDIVDIPLCDSNTFMADTAVPFMQIVLHGHIQYAGAALNLADDMTDTILKSAEYGANLHFTLSAENTRELKDTVYSNFYTIDFDTWKGDVLSLYTKFNDVFASLQDQEIENHETYADVSGVYITTYENGTRIAVNYNRNEVTVEGKTIPAQDFIVL